MKDIRYIDGVSTLVFREDKCVGCTLCTVVCPHGVFEMRDSKAAVVDLDGCMECGACVKNCPVDAIEVNPGVG